MVPRAAGLLPVGGRGPQQLGQQLRRARRGRRYDGRFYYHAYLARAAGPRLAQPRGARGDARRPALLVRPRRRRLPDRRAAPADQGRPSGATTRRTRAGARATTRTRALIPEFTTDRPEVQDAIRAMRAAVGDERLLIGELYLPIERLVAYYASGLDMPANFHLLTTPWEPRAIADLVERYEAALPDGAWPNWVLGNHDRPRLATRLGRPGARRRVPAADPARHADALLRRRARDARRRDRARAARRPVGLRQPRPGADADAVGRGRGRSPRGEPWLPFAADHATVNVEAQRDDPARCSRSTAGCSPCAAPSPTWSTAPTARSAADGDVLRFARGDSIEVRIDFAAGDGEILKNARGPRSDTVTP